MLPLRARRVVISEGVRRDARALERALRLAEGIAGPPPEWRSEAELERLRDELSRPGRRDARRAPGAEHPVVLLDAMRWEQEEGALFPGYGWAETRNGSYEWRENGVICQTAVELQTIFGCAFDCTYCPYTSLLNFACDLEVFVERLADLFRRRPTQLLYKLNNRSDTLCFEPEYGLSKLLVDAFARASGQQLMLYSKSDNVAHLLDLDHRGRTVTCFTLSSPATARLLEPSAPSFEARLDAAARCARAGYPVRFRLSPLVPLRGWQEELRAALRAMAAVVRPELVTLWTLSMTPLEDLSRVVDPALLDAGFLARARDAQEAMQGQKGAPFPEDCRVEMYGFVADVLAEVSPETRLSLCLETPEVIRRLEHRLALVGGAQVCNCGPRGTSGAVAGAPAVASTKRRLPLTVAAPLSELETRDAAVASAAGRRRRQRA